MTPTTNAAVPNVKPDPSPRTATILWHDYQPRERGVLDLLDDILQRCAEGRIRLLWHPGLVTEIPLLGGEPASFKLSFRNSAFRAILARLAAICHELSSQDVSPYGGRGDFTDPRWPNVRFHIDFMNTPAEQRLELTPVFSSEPT